MLLLVLASAGSVDVCAQKQVVLLKGEKVKLRLYPGDDFVYRLKGEEQVHRSYVNNVSDTAIVAHHDVVPFHRIDRLYFRHSSFANVIGGLLVVGGAGYFMIDQFNVVLVQGNKASLDENVTRTSVGMVAVGLPMLLFHKKYQRMKRGYRLLMVSEGSPFFRPDPRKLRDGFELGN